MFQPHITSTRSRGNCVASFRRSSHFCRDFWSETLTNSCMSVFETSNNKILSWDGANHNFSFLPFKLRHYREAMRHLDNLFSCHDQISLELAISDWGLQGAIPRKWIVNHLLEHSFCHYRGGRSSWVTRYSALSDPITDQILQNQTTSFRRHDLAFLNTTLNINPSMVVERSSYCSHCAENCQVRIPLL